MLELGYAGSAAGLSWCWSDIGAGCCVVVSWYLPGRWSEETKSDLGRLSEVSPEKSCLNEIAFVIGQVGCAGSAAVIGRIPRFLLRLVVRTQTPRSTTWFGGEDADPMLLREGTDTSSPLDFRSPALDVTASYKKWLLGCPRGVMVKAMNCRIVVREFVLQSRYYVHFRANTLGKGMNPLILPPAMGK